MTFIIFLIVVSLFLVRNSYRRYYRQKIDYRRHAGPGSIGVSTIPQGLRTLMHVAAILILLVGIGLSLIQINWDHIDTNAMLPFLPLLGLSASIWLSARNIGLLFIGPAGLAQARLSSPDRGDNKNGLVRWENVQHLDWDRDIGQRTWGLNLHYTNKKDRMYKIKLYIPRPEKDTLTELLNTYFHQKQLQEDSAGDILNG